MPQADEGRRPFRDRGTRLTLFGLLALVVGAANLGWAALQVALVALVDLGAGADPRAAALGAVLHVALAAAFFALGAGSIARRRWAPPLMLVLAWSWLCGGLLTLPLVFPVLGVALADAALPPGVATATMLIVAGIVACAGVLLPAAFVWVYREDDVRRTCEAHDPRPSWTESCPTPVLGLSVTLAALALLLLPLALRPVVPLFGVLVTGAPAALLLLACSAACAWLARATFRLSSAAWWATTAMFVLTGASAAATFARVPAEAMLAALGYGAEQLELFGHSGLLAPATQIGLTSALTLVSVVFMVAIKPHFRNHSSSLHV